ncbi:MAG: Dihydrolipoyl dehydrogenase [Deltaproteobacteria bacterium ADurb.Bin510]|nr:MAG: Dihydrolipoyl dehydrogenase [Deltaproteobacteria bacterium ADurb.Bin510]
MFDRPGVYTSEEIFELTEAPSSLAIVGGGVIGLEMAGVFEALGSKVTVIEKLPRILASEDAELSQELVRNYRKVRFMTETAVESLEGEAGQLKLSLSTPEGLAELEVAAVLLAVGRKPNLPAGAGELGLELNARGGLKVDANMRTSCANVYAVGDVTGEYTLAYVAAREAEAAVWDILGHSHPVDYAHIPSIVFTQPEIASVGDLPQGLELKSGSFPVTALGRARTMEASTGAAKVYVDEKDRLRRVSLMGPNVTELVSWASLAVEQGLTLAEFLKPCYPHPTMAEMLKEAAEDARGLCLNSVPGGSSTKAYLASCRA